MRTSRRFLPLAPRIAALALLACLPLAAQDDPPTSAASEAVDALSQSLRHRLDEIQKAVDDTLWFERVGDVAVVEKVRIYGPPKWKEENPTGIGAGNHVKFYTYLFTPREELGGQKLPLLVLPHGGVHSDFNTYYAHIVRELIAQGYVVVAPEYRGSTGYGRGTYEAIRMRLHPNSGESLGLGQGGGLGVFGGGDSAGERRPTAALSGPGRRLWTSEFGVEIQGGRSDLVGRREEKPCALAYAGAASGGT